MEGQAEIEALKRDGVSLGRLLPQVYEPLTGAHDDCHRYGVGDERDDEHLFYVVLYAVGIACADCLADDGQTGCANTAANDGSNVVEVVGDCVGVCLNIDQLTLGIVLNIAPRIDKGVGHQLAELETGSFRCRWEWR